MVYKKELTVMYGDGEVKKNYVIRKLAYLTFTCRARIV